MNQKPTVLSIVTDAIYKSGLVDRDFEKTVDGGLTKLAEYELNKLLDGWRNKIPFDTKIEFNDVTDLEKTKFVSISTLNYVIGRSTSYPLSPVSLAEFSKVNSVIGLKGMPSVYYFDLLTQNIEVYPKPTNSGKFIVNGRVAQINLGLQDEIPANMPLFMQDAVTWELAFRLTVEYGQEDWGQMKMKAYQNAIDRLDSFNTYDISPNHEACFSGYPSYVDVISPLYYLSGGK